MFARLGNSDVSTTTKAVATQPARPIYARLGTKSADERQAKPIPIAKDALKYEGILKSPPATKNVTITTTKNVRKVLTMRADETPVSVMDKLDGPKSVKFSSHVQYKVIEKLTKKAKKPSSQASQSSQIFNKPERRLTVPDAVTDGVKARLGLKAVNNLTVTQTVFNRLGEV